MKIQTFEVPYDSGRFQERMGRGPAALMKAGLVNRLRFLGHEVATERIRVPDEFLTEIKTTFALARTLAIRIAAAREEGVLSVVLSGNCNAALGTITGLDPSKVGVLWFDAHAEFNTPETTKSGFLDGMGLAIATGHCWRQMADSIDGFSRLSPKNVILAGVREIEAAEQQLLDNSGVQQIPASEIRERGMRPLLAPALAAMNRRVECMYIHFDLDVLDPSEARWNLWTPLAGLTVDEIQTGLELLAGGPPIAAVGFASYDPDIDPEASYEAARQLLDRALALAGA